MSDASPSFRTQIEKAAYNAVLIALAGRPRGNEAVMAFRAPTDPEAAVIADAMVHAGAVSDDLYTRLLTIADRRYAAFPHGVAQPVTRAIAFDAFGTLVHIGRKRYPFERLIRQARDRAKMIPSPMVQPMGLADYAAALGLPRPDAELAALDEELATIAPYPDTLDTLRRVRDQGTKIAVASNLAMPYAAPLKALLGDLIDVWHFSFNAGTIKPERAFYAGLTAKLGCEPDELLMVGDTWRDDIVGAVDAGSRAKWLNRDGRASYVRRFIAASSLADACPERGSATRKTEMELLIESIDANLDYLHSQRWANEMSQLRQAVERAPDVEKAAAKQAVKNHYVTRAKPENSRTALIQSASEQIEARHAND